MKKNVVITGGTKGIGRSLVMKFASEGFNIVTNSRNKRELEALCSVVESEYQVACHIMESDFQNPEEVIQFASFVKEIPGELSVLINNAGVFKPGGTLTEEEGVYDQLMAINMHAPYHITRALVPSLKRSQDAYIFNMCSTASFMPYINGGSYCISKFALLGFTKVLRQELKEQNIAVSAVMPGATLTNSWAGTDLPKKHFMNPDDVATLIWAAWTTRKSAVVEELVMRPYPGDL